MTSGPRSSRASPPWRRRDRRWTGHARPPRCGDRRRDSGPDLWFVRARRIHAHRPAAHDNRGDGNVPAREPIRCRRRAPRYRRRDHACRVRAPRSGPRERTRVLCRERAARREPGRDHRPQPRWHCRSGTIGHVDLVHGREARGGPPTRSGDATAPRFAAHGLPRGAGGVRPCAVEQSAGLTPRVGRPSRHRVHAASARRSCSLASGAARAHGDSDWHSGRHRDRPSGVHGLCPLVVRRRRRIPVVVRGHRARRGRPGRVC